MRKKVPKRGAAAGFTIVELLVVILIISILIALLVPSMGAARTRAKETKTRNLLKVIDVGVESFATDSVVGGDYPPSIWTNVDHEGTSGLTYFGAQTLVWAIAGADLMGTPGFKIRTGLTLSDLYGIDGTSSRPLHPRAGPYIDVSRKTLRTPTEMGLTTGIDNPDAPVFVDDFDMPVLYFKADRAQINMARYDRTHNQGFASSHPVWGGFQQFIRNFNITALTRPNNYDSYLLISAGPDGSYGTGDDITNYPLDVDNY